MSVAKGLLMAFILAPRAFPLEIGRKGKRPGNEVER